MKQAEKAAVYNASLVCDQLTTDRVLHFLCSGLYVWHVYILHSGLSFCSRTWCRKLVSMPNGKVLSLLSSDDVQAQTPY